jgi:hypothetical protein
MYGPFQSNNEFIFSDHEFDNSIARFVRRRENNEENTLKQMTKHNQRNVDVLCILFNILFLVNVQSMAAAGAKRKKKGKSCKSTNKQETQ